MSLAQRLKHKNADVRIQARRELEKLRALSVELRKVTPWWVD